MTRTHHTLVDPVCRCGHSGAENGPNVVRLDPESISAIADAVAERMATREVEPLALRVGQAARALGVSDEFFAQYVAPEVSVVRRGRAKMVPVTELRRWLSENGQRVTEGLR